MRKFHTFSVLFTTFLVYHDLKQKIRCSDASKYAFTHRNLPESEKYILIIQNVHEKYISITRQWSLVQPCRHSAVSAFTETVEFLERSLASILIGYCCSMIGCYFFLDKIGSQKHIATYNFHIK